MLWGLLAVPASLVLLGVAVTGEGRAFAFAGLLAGAGPFALARARLRGRQNWKRWAGIGAALWIAIVVFLFAHAPSGKTPPGARVQRIYFGHDPHPGLTAIANFVPEVDQLMFGFTVAMFVDPLLTSRQCRELKQLTAGLYDSLERDPAFHELGSAMSDTYADLLWLSGEHQQAYLYVPSGLDRTKPAPVLVFLHGSGGNFKAYLWLLSKVADRLNAVVIAPTDGMGLWPEADANAVIDRSLAAAARYVALDPRQIHLIGLSNGGLGVSRIGSSRAARFRSLMFLSPVIDRTSIRDLGFLAAANSCPILILTGEADDRIPVDYVRTCALELQATGAKVTLQTVPGANHFLVFSHPDLVAATLESWVRRN